jgi:hypothetical protein
MRLKAVTVTLASVCGLLVIVAPTASGCQPNGVDCAGVGTPRVAHGNDASGGHWIIGSVPSGSGLLSGGEPPSCSYSTGAMIPQPDGTSVAEPARTDGVYVYTEYAVNREETNQALVDAAEEIGELSAGLGSLVDASGIVASEVTQQVEARFTPLDALNRRFRVGCLPPQEAASIEPGETGRYDAPYGGFFDVGPWDPLFGLQQHVTRMRRDLQLNIPTFVDPPSVTEWGGLVVRHPTWLSVTSESWTSQTTPPVSHYGFSIQLLVIPASLSFNISFENNQRSKAAHGNKDWTGNVGCIGTSTPRQTRELDPGDDQVPARPDDPALEYAEPGIVEACAWSPPAPGTATITPTITYNVLLIVNGTYERLANYNYTGDAATFTVGELIAVNTVND